MRDAPLPDCSFAELAVEMRLIACREAYGAEALELLAARNPEGVFVQALAEVRRNAMLAASAAALLRALVPHEAAVRAMLKAEGR